MFATKKSGLDPQTARARRMSKMQWAVVLVKLRRVALDFFQGSAPPLLYRSVAAGLAVCWIVQQFAPELSFDVAEVSSLSRNRFERDRTGEEAARMWRLFQSRGGHINDSTTRLTTRNRQLHTQADVEGANMDHNMSVSNPCLTASDLLQRAYLQPPPEPFSAFGQHEFIMRSGYRTSPRDFVAVGMSLLRNGKKRSDLEMRRAVNYDCFWVGADGRIMEGSVRSIFPGEHHELMYETVVHRCTLDTPSTGPGGGSAYIVIGSERVLVHAEQAGEVDVHAGPRFSLGFCSFPMYRSLSAVALRDWLQMAYHYLEVQYAVLNDGGSIDTHLFPVVEPYVRAGMMEIADMRGEFKYETKHNVLTLNDCFHRMSYVAGWVLFLDFDEYLYVAPPATLRSLLQQHSDAPYVTFGSLWWSVELCRERPGADNLERMLFHWPHFYCVGEGVKYPQNQCLNYFGHRKFAVNPRLVDAVQVHRPIEPKEGGVDLDTATAHLNHFQGLLRADKPICTKPVEPGKQPEWWKEDEKLVTVWRRIKKRKTPPRYRA